LILPTRGPGLALDLPPIVIVIVIVMYNVVILCVSFYISQWFFYACLKPILRCLCWFFFFFNVNDWFTFMPTLSKQKLILWPNFRLVCATVFDMNVWFILMFTICEQNRVLWLGFRLVVLLFTFLEWYGKVGIFIF